MNIFYCEDCEKSTSKYCSRHSLPMTMSTSRDPLEELRDENRILRSALEKLWPYFRYWGGMPVFSPNDYSLIRRTIREALGMEER